jgi:glycosyltransferase involved in cell wall biosynthesis
MQYTKDKKILFVVHRYIPYVGGSEIYVANMAEEMLSRGYDVTVLSDTHQGDQNGVKVTSDHQVLGSPEWALIIVHGGDCSTQNVVHYNSQNIPSPVLYMIIKPSYSDICKYGAINHNFVGYSTNEDWDYLNVLQIPNDRRVCIPHGIKVEDSIGVKYDDRFPEKDSKYFVSIGGFWPHKGMTELAEVFLDVFKGTGIKLKLIGYSDHEPPSGENVLVFKNLPRHEVMTFVRNAEALIMNSIEEGFGLCLLEAMINETPWIARNIAGARVLRDYGYTYNTKEELKDILQKWESEKLFERWHSQEFAAEKVRRDHTIKNTVDNIEFMLIT